MKENLLSFTPLYILDSLNPLKKNHVAIEDTVLDSEGETSSTLKPGEQISLLIDAG